MIAPAGRHGGDGEAVARSLGLDPATVLDLSASLNPWAPPVAALLAKHADAVGRYPDPTAATEALAAAMGVDPDRLLLTNGGSEAIALVARELGGGVVAEPEFALHPRSDQGPRWRSDPHNPSGRLAGPDERADVWDEAFYPLATGRWTAGRDAVVVGSLTKVWACPGLRLGYVLADDVERFARHQPHWATSTLALAVVEDALADTHLDVWAAAIAEQRAALVALLAAHGLTAEPSEAPWVLVEAPGLRASLAPHGVVVRDCTSFGLPDHARLAVPGPEGLARLAQALDRRGSDRAWPRPVPLIGDTTSAAERAAQPDGWRLADPEADGLYAAIHRRRDVRRYRAATVPDDVLRRVLAAGHAAPSVGHSQPWRFVLVRDPATRDRAALLADHERLVQADALEPEAARHLLDLQLEGIREAPLGIVVACDRRTPAAGVLGRRTFPDADLWSCACAIQNLWLAARAEGLGLGWVTLFEPAELAGLVGLPEGVEPLGWLCVGWPDERNPDPGLERAGWSARLPLEDVVLHERWSEPGAEPAPPVSRLRAPGQPAVVGARDQADTLLTTLGSLGVLDRAVDRVVALGHADLATGTLVLAVGRHLVTELGVSAFAGEVTDDVLAAARAGQALGVVAATSAGLAVEVVDAGTATGILRDDDALTAEGTAALVAQGEELGRRLGERGLVALGEVGMGNTTVAAALAAALLGLAPDAVVGLGAGADTAMLDRKRDVVAAALARTRTTHADPIAALAAVGGPELALLTGVTLGATAVGAPVVLDGLATSVAALVAVRSEPAVAAHLVAGQRSREPGHAPVLVELGLEPLLDLRLRAGEGAGASLASSLLLHALQIRRATARTR